MSLQSISLRFSAGDSIAHCQKISPLDGLETRMLLSHVLGLTRVQLITHNEQTLTSDQANILSDVINRRVAGEPIAYLIGEREFFGLNFKVSPAVLIPRPDTELLVELAIEKSQQQGHVLDLGTGSGAIAISLASQRPDLNIIASDISEAALNIAKHNAQSLLPKEANINLIQSDWYQNIGEQQFHTIVSNPPYIVKDDAHLSEGDLRFEPINALTDHADGLSAYRTIIAGACTRLQANGWLLMEHGYDQAQAVQDLLSEHGFIEVQSWKDLAGILRVTGGKWIK
jgi:release factor glutamine methyltransferase